MPIIEPLMSATSWKEATLHLGPISLAYGSFIAELFNFFILALVIFVIAKKLLRMNVPAKK